MPKIIEGLKETIAVIGKKILLEEGYQKLTMREVARRSEIALGTVYNYFSSKDELVAQIMFEDWASMFHDTSFIEQSESCIDGLQVVYMQINQFSMVYRSVWAEYGSTSALTPERHALLVKQIHSLIIPLFERFSINDEDHTSVFITEVILNAAVRENVEFEMIRPFIEKLLK